MVKLGLVKKNEDSKRKNPVRLSLMDKGLQVYRQRVKRESINWIFSVLPEEEQKQLRLLLEKLQNSGLALLGISNRLPYPWVQLENKLREG